MIYFVTTASHAYTHACLEGAYGGFKRITYPVLLSRRQLPRGVYIFSDFDRLSPWQLEVAAGVFRQLKAAGCRVLNDPARAAQRLSLLQKLHRHGMNSFKAWPADEADVVDAFPVFLRTRAAHRGVLSEPLADRAALQAELEQLIQAGYPRSDLMVVEYRAEPVREGLFRKLSVYRVGERTVPACSVHERSWAAKYGELGVAGQDLYDDEYRIVQDNPFGDDIKKAFALADIDYGRADFGLVDGKVEIYEINTNPSMALPGKHPFPVREASMRSSHQQYMAALTALDEPLGGVVRLERPALMNRLSRFQRMLPAHQWLP